jgi:RHS repeat-associated protein
LARSATYSAYGVAAGANTFEPRLGYRGELTLENQVHLRARSFQPSIGQFLSVDPVEGIAGTTTVNNRYTYANNDPVHQIDPLGLYGIDDGTLGAQRWPDVAVVFVGSADASPAEVQAVVQQLGVLSTAQAVGAANADSGWAATGDAVLEIGEWTHLGKANPVAAAAGIAIGCVLSCLGAYRTWQGAWAAQDAETYNLEVLRQKVRDGRTPPGQYGAYALVPLDNHGTPRVPLRCRNQRGCNTDHRT